MIENLENGWYHARTNVTKDGYIIVLKGDDVVMTIRCDDLEGGEFIAKQNASRYTPQEFIELNND